MTNRTLTVICGMLVIAALAIAFAAGAIRTSSEPADSAGPVPSAVEGTPGDMQPVPVQVVRVQQRPLTRRLNIPATLEAYEKAELYAKISGYVAKMKVDIGSTVRAGDVLMEIAVPEMVDELRRLGAVLEAKRAREKLEELTTKRKEQLAAEEAISQQELDEALGQLAIARADARVAEANAAKLRTLLDYATVTAPFSGTITARRVDSGDFVRSAAEGQSPSLFALARTDKIRLVIQVPETDVPYVGIGTEVAIKPSCLDETIQSTVARTAAALNAVTRTMRVEVDLDNKNGQLNPGMYAQVSVILQTKARARLIPAKAIRAKGGDTFVLVAREGLAQACPVEIGYDDGLWAEVIGGELRDDDWVITSAGSAVAPASRVKPVQETDAAAAVSVENRENGDDDGQHT